ncbi:11358_t:CDS:2, partial [Gigaspora margarita]
FAKLQQNTVNAPGIKGHQPIYYNHLAQSNLTHSLEYVETFTILKTFTSLASLEIPAKRLALPNSSNQKNRIERWVKIATSCLKAYEKEVALPSSQEFWNRIAEKELGFYKVVGYENIINMVANYLDE